MRDSMASVSQPPIYTGPQGGSSLVSVEIGSVLHLNESVISSGPRAGQKPGQETNEVYETANIDCQQDANTQVQYTGEYLNLLCICLWISGKKYLNVAPAIVFIGIKWFHMRNQIWDCINLWHIYLFRILRQKKESKEKSEILELDPWNMFLLKQTPPPKKNVLFGYLCVSEFFFVVLSFI